MRRHIGVRLRPPRLLLLSLAFYLLGDSAGPGDDVWDGEDDEGGEFPADDKDEEEDGNAARVVARAEDELEFVPRYEAVFDEFGEGALAEFELALEERA